MSKRNSQEAKRAARERLRAERERRARRGKIRRQATVGGTVVAILAIVGAGGVALAGMGGDGDDNTDWTAVRDQVNAAGGDGSNADTAGDRYPTKAPANTTGEDGLTIRVGDEDAEHTLTLFEDPRCPACASFEQAMGENVRQGIEDGTYQVEYVFGTFIDGNVPGTGSKNALNALGAALDVSTEAFLDYHDALYSVENHPSESEDEFSDDERLIEIAQEVPELRDNQQFEDDVMNSTFAYWALRMSDTFDNDPEVTSTPTLKWDGEVIDTPQSAEAFDAMVEENTK